MGKDGNVHRETSCKGSPPHPLLISSHQDLRPLVGLPCASGLRLALWAGLKTWKPPLALPVGLLSASHMWVRLAMSEPHWIFWSHLHLQNDWRDRNLYLGWGGGLCNGGTEEIWSIQGPWADQSSSLGILPAPLKPLSSWDPILLVMPKDLPSGQGPSSFIPSSWEA